ncbi:MAG TPA: hypothetical protein VHW45_09635 [Candidatus Sulfotelmatobacter sp.]|jgi:hypothetical protein|nr:hypothetical protein [Candidatus Sulfotelmatobacter sp.]
MTLLDAQEYDQEKSRKRTKRIILSLVIVVVILFLGWWFRYWPEEHLVGHFFKALQKQDYKTAYGIWMHDPGWEQHPQQYSKYAYGDFYRDWGPGGEWGLIKTEKVYGASTCPGPGSGVVVDVIVNDRAQHAQVWVEKSDKTLSFPPCELIFH